MKNIYALLSAILLILFDQYTKHLVVVHLKPITRYPLIENVFELHYAENTGASFGILPGWRWMFLVLTAITLVAIVVYYLKLPRTKPYRFMRIALVLVFSGAIGNFIDRLINHYVVDFFYFKLINFAIFNMADTYVVIGTISFAILYLFYTKEDKKPQEEQEAVESNR